MSTEVQTELDRIVNNITAAFTAVGNKGGTVPSSKVSGNLASAINSIPSGVTVQRKSGSFITNYAGAATVDCGFKPDFVALDGNAVTNGYTAFSGVPFQEGGSDNVMIFHHPSNSQSYITSIIGVARTETGFSVSAQRMSTSLAFSNDSYRTIEYIAVKYTE